MNLHSSNCCSEGQLYSYLCTKFSTFIKKCSPILYICTQVYIWVASQMTQWEQIRLPMQRCSFDFWVRKIAWRRKWQSIPGFLPRKSHGQRSLVGYSPRGSWTPTHLKQLNRKCKQNRYDSCPH